MKVKNLTLSMILKDAKENNKSICRELSVGLNELGYKISDREIRNYKSGKIVPSFDITKEILNLLCSNEISNYKENLFFVSYSDKEIKEIILNSKNVIGTHITDEPKFVNVRKISKRVTLKSDSFSFIKNVNPLLAIEDKVKSEFGTDKGAFSRYVSRLINEDMKKKS